MSFQTCRGQALPTLVQVAQERKKLQQRSHRRQSAASFIAGFLLIVTSGVMILILFMPVLEVSGRSMEPTLPVDSLVYVEPADPAEIQPREIVAFWRDGTVVTHRVVENQTVIEAAVRQRDEIPHGLGRRFGIQLAFHHAAVAHRDGKYRILRHCKVPPSAPVEYIYYMRISRAWQVF